MNCCHCFSPIGDTLSHTKCDSCRLALHFNCLNMSGDEISFLSKAHSPNIKVFCNRCSVTLSATAELKTLISELKSSFDQRLSALENAVLSIPQSANVVNKEEMLRESIERAWRANNLIFSNVPENSSTPDAPFIDELLEIIDPLIIVNPSKISRIGKSNGQRPRLLKVVFENPAVARSVLKGKIKLRGSKFDKVLIQDDKTKAQRDYLTAKREELNRRTQGGEPNLTIKYVSGVPEIITVASKNQ